MDRVEISVVVPVFNPGARLDACLGALRRQEPGVGFEIVVVDSGSDGTASRLEGREGVKVVTSHRRLFPGTGRNLGVRSASGRVICFTDADCVPATDWLASLWAARPDLSGAVVGGPILNGTPDSLVGTAEYLSEMSAFTQCPRREPEFFPTANLSIGREAFERVGGFADLEKGSDVVFGADCRAEGLDLVFDPSVRVVHLNRTRLAEFLRNQVRLGAGAGTNRTLYGMRGSSVARNPAAWPLVPAARLLKICARVLSCGEPGSLLKVLPLVLPGAFAYGWGFAGGAARTRGRVNRESTCR